MVKEINATFLTLIPKIKGAATIQDFCEKEEVNTIYKIISKFIVARLLILRPDLLSSNQLTFTKGRLISDIVSLVEELLKGLILTKG